MSDRQFGIGEPPQSVLLAIEQLISGERSIGEFRDELLNVLYDNPGTSAALSTMVNDYSRRGLIPEPIQRLLLRDIDKITNEEHPTTPTEFTYEEHHTSDLELNRTDAEFLAEEEANDVSADVAEKPALPADDLAVSSDSLDIGTLLRGRFEIVGRATGGSMGVVYKAIDRRLAEAEGGQPFVAIKVLAPEYAGHATAMRALQQEAAKGRYLNHPSIVRFLDLDRTGDIVYLVMEWLEGRALSEVLNERPGEALPQSQAFQIVEEVGKALDHAHQMGVTHADVKPGNIMLLADGSVKLLDFGIARARGGHAPPTLVTDDAFIRAATPAYASPAVLEGKPARPVDDVFSLACLAYRLLSGYRVFRNKTALEARKEGREAARYTGAESRIWKALHRALALDENDRTPSISQLLHDLKLSHADGERSKVWTWTAFTAVSLFVLAAVAIYVPQIAVTVEPVLPEVAVTEVSDTEDNADIEHTGVPVPVIEFTVESASFVETPDVETVLDLEIGGEVTAIPEAELLLPEGAGEQAIRLHLADGLQEDALALAWRLGNEPSRRAIQRALRLEMVPDTSASESATTLLMVEHLDDALLQPELMTTVEIQHALTREVLARISLRLEDDEMGRMRDQLPPDTLSFSRDIVEVVESDGAVALTLWRLNPTDKPISAELSIAPLGAVPDEDYVAPDRIRLEFGVGEIAETVVIPLVSDSLRESTELLSVRHNQEGNNQVAQGSVTVRILDDDE
ncbi:MAG: protein kinase [Pseudomonadota bacterium]